MPWTYADALKNPKPDSPKKVELQKDIIIMEVPSIIGEPVECKKSEDSKPSEDAKKPEENSSSSASPEDPKKPGILSLTICLENGKIVTRKISPLFICTG